MWFLRPQCLVLRSFHQTVKRCLIRQLSLCVVFTSYVQVFKMQFSLPKDMSIQIVSGERSIWRVFALRTLKSAHSDIYVYDVVFVSVCIEMANSSQMQPLPLQFKGFDSSVFADKKITMLGTAYFLPVEILYISNYRFRAVVKKRLMFVFTWSLYLS